jgi:hypothetical protein
MGREHNVTASYWHGTKVYLPINVELNEVPVTANVTVCVALAGVDPVTFVTPDLVSGALFYMIQGLTPGFYKVWAKVTSSPEIPVFELGEFRVY